MIVDDCIFCKIVSGEIPSKPIYEDDKFIVILDRGPISKGHALVIPKDHHKDLFTIPDELVGEAMKVAKKMAIRIEDKLNCEGFNVVQNNNEIAGQTVFHFHIHLIPRYEGDGVKINWKPGSISEEELEELFEILKG